MLLKLMFVFGAVAMLGSNITANRIFLKVTMSDLEDAVDEANTTLTKRYDEIMKSADEAINSDMIPNALADMYAKVLVANEIINGLGGLIFKQIEEVEAIGGYDHCIVGLREKTLKMMYDAGKNLVGCGYGLQYVAVNFNVTMATWITLENCMIQRVRRDVLSCLPAGSDPSEEDIEKAVICVQKETTKAGHLLDTSQKELEDILKDTRGYLELGKSEAVKCVNGVQRGAYDQTGYLLSILNQCVAGGTTPATTGTTIAV